MFAPRAAGATPIQDVGSIDWIKLTSDDAIGTVAVDAYGFRMSIEARPGGSADLTLGLSFVVSSDRFGPVASMEVPPVATKDARLAILAESIDRFKYGGGYRVSLRVQGDASAHATPRVEISMTDEIGRRLIVFLPTEGPLRDLFDAVLEHRAAGAG